MEIAIKTTCAECGTPLWGVNLNKRGESYYCSADFERLSPEEDLVNQKTARDYEDYQKLFDGSAALTDLAINGGFDTDTDWTKGTGWTISDGKARCDGSAIGVETALIQPAVKIIDVPYIYTVTISDYESGVIGIVWTSIQYYRWNFPAANGTYSLTIKQAFPYDFNELSANSVFVGNVDNFSVKRKKT